MKRGTKIVLFLLFLIILGIVLNIVKNRKINEENIEPKLQIASQKVTDECIEEQKAIMMTNAVEQKVSPNAIIIFKRNFKKCGHTTKENKAVNPNLVNLSKSEFEKIYKEWNLEGFSNSEIVLSKAEEGICDEHYVLREEDERIVIYRIDEQNNEKIFERTAILTKYLPQTDKINIQNGILINGKEALNCVLEDYE